MKEKSIISFMTAFMGIALLLCVGVLSSCLEHKDAYYGNTSIGSVLLDDNSIIAVQGIDSVNKSHVVGVVIGSRSDSVWIVSTKELGQYSYLDTLQSINNVSSDIRALNGRENTAALLQSDRTSDAAIAVQNFNDNSPVKGWFLPSLGELRMLANNLSSVSSTMQLVDGDPFVRSQYLSSTQDGSNSQTEALYAYCVTLQSNYVSSILKLEKAQVRPILRLKIK